MNVAIVYDRVNKWGGAEQVLLILHEMFPQAPLFTSVYDENKAKWASVFPQIKPSFLQKIPFMQDKHELLGSLTPMAFEQFNFDEYEVVISVTSEAAKGIIAKPSTLHICYCLTPTRYLWSHYDSYFKNPFFKVLTKPLVNYLRKWDKISSHRPDVMIAISGEVQNRIEKYYGRNAEVIHPPVNLEKFKVSGESPGAKDGFYLFVSRLVPYKRADLALEAFAELKLPLLVVGTGSDETKLRSRFENYKNIVFKGFVEDKELVNLYKGAKALVFPGEEDFGIVMVEAQAAGVPVIAFKKGGALDIVKEGESGIFFNEQSKSSLIKAIESFEKSKFSREVCVENSKRFSKIKFVCQFNELLGNTVKSS